MPVGRHGGTNSLRVEGGKNRETVTASLRLILVKLVAPAMATPHWSK